MGLDFAFCPPSAAAAAAAAATAEAAALSGGLPCLTSAARVTRRREGAVLPPAKVRMDAQVVSGAGVTGPRRNPGLPSEKLGRTRIDTALLRTDIGNFGSRRLRLFSGQGSPALANEIATYLGKRIVDKVESKKFADNEAYVRIQDSVRGCDVYLIQSTCAPANDNLMELLLLIDATRRAHAAQITVVIPYYGYARADRIVEQREALASKLVANMITKAGANRVVLMDIHSPQSPGFFDLPLDHMQGTDPLVRHLKDVNKDRLDDVVIVSPDVGGVARARAFAKRFYQTAPLAIVDKRRSAHNVAESLNVIGDVDGKVAILLDDMIDTAGTITEAAKLLKSRGATLVYGAASHALFNGPAVDRLSTPGLFEQIVVTNSVPVPADKLFPQLQVVSVAEVLGDAIWRIHEDFNSALFM